MSTSTTPITFLVSQMVATTATWSYKIDRKLVKRGDPLPDLWTIRRWKLEDVHIPPLGRVLSMEGWTPMLAADAFNTRYVSQAEIEKFID